MQVRWRPLGGMGLVCAAVVAGCSVSTETPTGVASAALGGQDLVVNECSAGTAGFIELFNTGTSAIELTNDAVTCWYVDDVSGGGAPKRITDAVVNHAAGSTTCSGAGRSATCGLVGPGEHVWIPYSYVNSTTADACRLVTTTKSGSTCGTTYTDLGVGGPTAATAAGQCFGRDGSGGPWASGPIACTQGAANPGACSVGASCSDGDACTTGETISASCTCGGGTPVGCDDGNPCTTDSCASASGCAHTAVADGTACGAMMVCSAGTCTPFGGGGDAVITRQGAADKLLLQGTIVTPDVFFEGELLIEGDTITCVAASCSGQAGAATATIVQTHGIILPGLIDTHNHVLYDIFDETDWTPPRVYSNHNQWTSDARYQALVDAKQYLNGEGSPVSVGCEMNKYGELKALVAGTTSVAGAANPANKACYGSLARTIDQTPNDLAGDKIQVATLFPSTSTADAVCSNIASGGTDAYVIHVAEGVDATALAEFDKLYTTPTTDGCLHVRQTAIVHGTALQDAQLSTMANSQMSLVWSPRSNVFLYGGAADLTKTTNVPLALSKGINVALAPDWSIGGSQNLLDELRFADSVDNSVWGDVITPKMLVQMVTINAARALGLDATIGSLAVGKKADVFVIGGDRSRPYDALLASTPKDVRLVAVGGKVLYGDAQLTPLGPAAPGCEALSICGSAKFVCVAETGGTASNKLGQTYAEITSVLSTELSRYDALELSPWDFSPVAPLVKCP